MTDLKQQMLLELPLMRRKLKSRVVKAFASEFRVDRAEVRAAIEEMEADGLVDLSTFKSNGRTMAIVNVTQAGLAERARLVLAARRAGR